MISRLLKPISLVSVLLLLSFQPSFAQKDDEKGSATVATPILWQHPGNIGSRDLFYGPGAADVAPVPPFVFVEEDKDGESPKFKVIDARRVIWSVKLGPEAQAETVATRLVWAVGYFAEEAYYFDKVKVESLPRLSRGQEHVRRDSGEVYGARFEPRREGIRKAGTWDWNKNPFAGTKELSGLKVIMILLNNYDARSENNKVLVSNDTATNQMAARYVVTDLGASLGRAGGLGGKRSKNDLEDYLSTRFVMGVEDGAVEFDYDTRPTKLGMVSVLYPPYYKGEVKKEKSMRGIPVEHARWIGSLLSQLSADQLRDAFRAAGYEARTMEEYVRAIRLRISQLTRL
ncbi:MAG TPA: hypothetical protein VFM05_07715 [Candidatus Saccharimonadales bacterium]|nr:hypothetical protein [Candidatus Saccharimonadales bacterium]